MPLGRRRRWWWCGASAAGCYFDWLSKHFSSKGGHTLINTWLGFTDQNQLKFFKKSSGLPAFTHARASASAFELESER